MGIENRKRKIEKSDLESFSEIKWDDKKDNSTKKITMEDLDDIKDLLTNDPYFSELEVAKATKNVKFEEKQEAQKYDEKMIDELLDKLDDLIK